MEDLSVLSDETLKALSEGKHPDPATLSDKELSYLAANPPQFEGKSIGGFLSNAVNDIPSMAAGIGNTIKEGAYDMPRRALETGLEMAAGKSYSDTPSGKQDVTLAKTAPDQLKDMVRPITHPIDYTYEHPIQQALNVASVAAPFVSRAAATGAQYAGRFGENQAIKTLGRVPPGMTSESARALARTANDYGLLDADMGPIGRQDTVQSMAGQAGVDLGDIRDAASESGPAMTGQQMADAIRAKLKEAYSEGGTNFDQVGELERQLANIQNMKSTTPADFANRATEINQKARGKGMMLPHNVDTDISGAMSGINDEEIAKRLPDSAEDYAAKRQMFGDMSDLGNMVERGEKRILNQRGGNTLFEQGKKFTEELGSHKIGAKVGFGVESGLQSVAKNAPGFGIGGVTSHLMNTLSTNPQALGKYAAPLMKAAQEGGNNGLAATHFILSTTYPEYNQLMSGQDEQTQP